MVFVRNCDFFSSFCFNAKWIKKKCLVMVLKEKMTSLHEYKKGTFGFFKKRVSSWVG